MQWLWVGTVDADELVIYHHVISIQNTEPHLIVSPRGSKLWPINKWVIWKKKFQMFILNVNLYKCDTYVWNNQYSFSTLDTDGLALQQRHIEIQTELGEF